MGPALPASNSYRSVSPEAIPDLLAWLGRCMCARKDRPDSALWRTAMAEFFDVIDRALEGEEQGVERREREENTDAETTGGREAEGEEARSEGADGAWVLQGSDASNERRKSVGGRGGGREGQGGGESRRGSRDSEDERVMNEELRLKLWAELVQIFEGFLRAACGSDVVEKTARKVSIDQLRADLAMEERMVDVLAKVVLRRCGGASREVKERLIYLIVELSESVVAGASEGSSQDCFNRLCLRSISHFGSLCRRRRLAGDGGGQARNEEVEEIVLPLFIRFSRAKIRTYARDCLQKDHKEIPPERTKEVVAILVELEALELSPSLAPFINPQLCLARKNAENGGLGKGVTAEEDMAQADDRVSLDEICHKFGCRRAHLFFLYREICDLVLSSEQSISEPLHRIFGIIGEHLGLKTKRRIVL